MGKLEPPHHIVPLQWYFAAKLLLTTALSGYLALHPDIRKQPPAGLGHGTASWIVEMLMVLIILAIIQIFVMVGLARRSDKARQLGEAVCIIGRVVAVLLCLGAPLFWIVGVPIAAMGLTLLYLNGLAIAALRSREVRGWCDGKPEDRGEF